jgi:proteasome lid subunit RPN8/RPN11
MNGLYLYVQFINDYGKEVISEKIYFPKKTTEIFIQGEWDSRGYKIREILDDSIFGKRIIEIVKEIIGKKGHLYLQVFQDGICQNPGDEICSDIKINNNELFPNILGKLKRALFGVIANSLTQFNHLQNEHVKNQIKIQTCLDIKSSEIVFSEDSNIQSTGAEEIKLGNTYSRDVGYGEKKNNGFKQEDLEIILSDEALTAQRGGAFLPIVYIRKTALRCAEEHALHEKSNETGGVLIGRFIHRNKKEPPIVVVVGIVRGEHTIKHPTRLTFTDDTWAQIWNWIDHDPEYSDDTKWVIVGWYHTHPSLGIFLSSYDKFIHKEYFQLLGHIALVIDPNQNKHGFFCWEPNQKDVIRCNEKKVLELNDKEILSALKTERFLPRPEILKPPTTTGNTS